MLPPARLDLLVVALGQLAVTLRSAWTVQRCSRAVGPDLPRRLPDPGCPVGDHERRRAQAAGDHVPGEREPAVVALTAPQGQPEQDLAALQGDAPAHQDALCGLIVGAHLQVDRVEEQVHDVVLLKAPLAPVAVSLAGVLTDPRDRALGRDRLLEDLLQRRLHVARGQAPQEAADHQRLQRVRAGHALAENPTLEPQLARVANPRALHAHRAARRLDRPRFMPVAVADRLVSALIAPAAQELRDLVLQRLLQDQTRSQAADRPPPGPAPRRHRPAPHPALGETSRSGLPSPCGRTSIFDLFRVKAEATPATSNPPAHETRPTLDGSAVHPCVAL